MLSRGVAVAGIAAVAATVAIGTACTGPHPAATPPDTGGDVPASAPSAPARPQGAVMGATLQITSDDSKAAYTVGNLRPVPPDAQIVPAKGDMYAVDVTIKAESGTTTYNGFYFAARAADGSSIAPAVGAVRPGITYGELPQGQKVAGHVAFDVAPGKSIVQVILRDPHGTPLGIWSAA
jgi:hypothetical protein